MDWGKCDRLLYCIVVPRILERTLVNSMLKTLNVSMVWLTRAVSKIFVFCLILLLGMTTATVFPSPALAVSTGGIIDMVFVVDESSSMENEHDWLKDAVVDLEAALTAAGVGAGDTPETMNRYGLVGFAADNNQRNRYLVGGDDFGTSEELVTALDQLPLSGGTEDGYAAMDEALDYDFRAQAGVNIVLVTDEARDNTEADVTYQSLLEKFSDKRALLNAVVDLSLKDGSGASAVGVDGDKNAYLPDGSGGYTESTGGVPGSGGATEADYADLAWEITSNGAVGAVWDLKQLRDGGLLAESFSNAFSAVKVEEAIEAAPVILSDEDKDFEVCADSADGQLVYSIVESSGGGDYLFSVEGTWTPGDGSDYEFDGNQVSPGADKGFAYTDKYEYSLVVQDEQYGFIYQLSSNPELPMYTNDYNLFIMNDVVGEYGDNDGCLQVHAKFCNALGDEQNSRC